MSDQKRLGIAWGTTFAMIFSAVVAANTVDSKQQPEGDAVLAAHQSFQENVATVMVEEKTTSLKPEVELADQKPELEETLDVTQESAVEEVVPISEPVEEAVVEASEPMLITPIEQETPDDSPTDDSTAGNESFEEDLPQDTVAGLDSEEAVSEELAATEPETTTTEPAEAQADTAAVEVAEVAEEVELLQEETAIESIVSPPVAEAVTIETEAATETLTELAEESQLVATIETPASDALPDVPAVEAEPMDESTLEEAPPAGAISLVSTSEAGQAKLADPSPPIVIEVPTVPSTVDAKKTQAKPFFGVGMRNPADSIITTIYAGSTAESLGIKLGDRLVSVNGQAVANVATLRGALQEFKVDDPTIVEVERKGTKYELGPKPLGSR